MSTHSHFEKGIPGEPSKIGEYLEKEEQDSPKKGEHKWGNSQPNLCSSRTGNMKLRSLSSSLLLENHIIRCLVLLLTMPCHCCHVTYCLLLIAYI